MVDKNALIKDYQNLSFYHIKLARLMRNHNQYKTAVILCNWALTSMIRAFYICENREKLGDEEILFIKISVPRHKSLCLAFDVMIFVDKLNFLINDEEMKMELMERKEMDQILHKTEKVLVELSRRVMNSVGKKEIVVNSLIDYVEQDEKATLISEIEFLQQKYGGKVFDEGFKFEHLTND